MKPSPMCLVLAGLLVLVAASAAAAADDVRVLAVSIDDPQPWGQGPRGAVVVSPGQKLAGRITLNRVEGAGALRVRWRDGYGRIGGETTITKIDALEMPYELPLDHPVASRGWVEVILQLAAASRVVAEPQPAQAPFVVHLRPTAWDEHYIFVWAHYPAGFGDLIRSLGLSGQDTYRFNPEMVEAIQLNDLYTYVDNIYWPIFSGYLKRPEVTRTILKAWAENPRDSSLWERTPSLADAGLFETFRDPMQQAAQANSASRLMFYNMVDELGLALMAAPNNFDWSRSSRVAFGHWLRSRYGSLAALNAQWDTDFATWNEAIGLHPTFEAMFDRLYGRVLLERHFKTVEAINKAFGGGDSVPTFAAAAGVYAALRTSRTINPDYITAQFKRDRDNPLDLAKFNKAAGTSFKSLEHLSEFGNNFDAWTFTLKAGDEFAGWNLAPWCDFRQFMDEQVAEGVGAMRRIGRQFDPGGRFGITGTYQPNAAAGHNYALLADQVDVLVPYDVGSAARILHGLRPEMIVLRPVWPSRFYTAYAWCRLLDGDNGTIYWDNDEPGLNFIDRKTGRPTELATNLAPVHRDITRGIGKQVLAGGHDDCGVAVYYSQASVRVGWWRRHLGTGRKWVEISSGRAVSSDQPARVRHSWCDLLETLGLQYRFVSAEQVSAGHLRVSPPKVLVLPEVTALSDLEAAEIQRFARAGGVVVADRLAAVFDEHGKARAAPALAGLWNSPNGHLLNINIEPFTELWRKDDKQAEDIRKRLEPILAAAGVQPPARVFDRESTRPVVDYVLHTWRLGGSARLLGLTANWSEISGSDAGRIRQGPRRLALRLPNAAHAWDVRAGKSLGKLQQVSVDLGDDYCAILALADASLPPVKADLVREGRLVRIRLQHSSAEVSRVVRVSVADPAGRDLPHYGANVLLSEARGGQAEHVFALALNDPPGKYVVHIRDILTGQTETLPLEVKTREN